MAYRDWMRTFATVLGALLVLGGTVWVLQGFNVGFAPQSFMSGNPRWVAYGSITVLAGVGLGIYGLRSSR